MVFRRRVQGLVTALSLPGVSAVSMQSEEKYTASQFVMTRLSSRIIHTINCWACGAEQRVHFSPAFTFTSSARGPPDLA